MAACTRDHPNGQHTKTACRGCQGSTGSWTSSTGHPSKSAPVPVHGRKGRHRRTNVQGSFRSSLHGSHRYRHRRMSVPECLPCSHKGHHREANCGVGNPKQSAGTRDHRGKIACTRGHQGKIACTRDHPRPRLSACKVGQERGLSPKPKSARGIREEILIGFARFESFLCMDRGSILQQVDHHTGRSPSAQNSHPHRCLTQSWWQLDRHSDLWSLLFFQCEANTNCPGMVLLLPTHEAPC